MIQNTNLLLLRYKLRIYNTYSMAGLCYLAYTATHPRGSAPWAYDCVSHMWYIIIDLQSFIMTEHILL